jgi:hypothetical protein
MCNPRPSKVETPTAAAPSEQQVPGNAGLLLPIMLAAAISSAVFHSGEMLLPQHPAGMFWHGLQEEAEPYQEGSGGAAGRDLENGDRVSFAGGRASVKTVSTKGVSYCMGKRAA